VIGDVPGDRTMGESSEKAGRGAVSRPRLRWHLDCHVSCRRTMRRHHEELAIASSACPVVSLLVPFSAALWARIKSVQKSAARAPDKGAGED
jgi:hypothetical protein